MILTDSRTLGAHGAYQGRDSRRDAPVAGDVSEEEEEERTKRKKNEETGMNSLGFIRFFCFWGLIS
jgi:hypothetical protein